MSSIFSSFQVLFIEQWQKLKHQNQNTNYAKDNLHNDKFRSEVKTSWLHRTTYSPLEMSTAELNRTEKNCACFRWWVQVQICTIINAKLENYKTMMVQIVFEVLAQTMQRTTEIVLMHGWVASHPFNVISHDITLLQISCFVCPLLRIFSSSVFIIPIYPNRIAK